MKNIIILLSAFCFIFLPFAVASQPLLSKLVIEKRDFSGTYKENIDGIQDSLYRTSRKSITNKKQIYSIYKALNNWIDSSQILTVFDIDTNYIYKNIDKIIEKYKESNRGKYYRNKINNNIKQKELLIRELSNINNYKSRLFYYLSEGCCYHMHQWYRSDFVFKFYYRDSLISTYTSRKHYYRNHLPYTNEQGNQSYSFEVDDFLNTKFKLREKQSLLKGNNLIQYLANEIIDSNIQNILKLARYTYEEEIAELSTDFTILSAEQVYGFGREAHKSNTINISLKNNKMLPNVYLHFMATFDNQTLYSRDSLKKDYKNVLQRVQNIPFIRNYLLQDTNAVLDIFYYDNQTMIEELIEGVNKNPEEWKKQDEYIESLKRYEKNNIQPSFDLQKAIKTSEHLHCGCNYKFERAFIEQAIFFEVTDAENASMLCYLLPDDTVLVYHIEAYRIEGVNIFNQPLSELFKQESSLPWACIRFDKYGKVIPK